MEENLLKEMIEAFDHIQMPRTKFELEHFIIKNRDTEADAYAHCVLELSILYDNLRIAKLKVEIAEEEIRELQETGKKVDVLNAEVKKIELEQLHRARLGAMREFEACFDIWKSFPKKYTRAELDADQPEFWERKITRQADQDVLATGRVSVGNLDALRMIGKGIVPALDVVRDTERRFLEGGRQRALIVVATEEQALNGLPVLEGLTMPGNVEIRILNVWGRSIDDAYDYAAQQAIEDDADWLITVEDDTFPQPDALVRLLRYAQDHLETAVGAWYPKRSEPREGTAIVMRHGKRQYLNDDGGLHEVYALPMGCTVYPVEMFLKIPRPWFATTSNLTQDSFFSQLAREHGYKLMVDTSIKCRHVDRKTGEVFE